MFYPFSFNVKYSLWKYWLEILLIWGEDYEFQCVIEAHPDMYRNMYCLSLSPRESCRAILLLAV